MERDWKRIRAEIDLDAILYNFGILTRERSHTKFYAVLKADGYGHGAAVLARLLQDRAYGFAVATVEEAIELRDGGIRNPILILGSVAEEFFEDLIRREIRFTVFDAETASRISSEARTVGKRALLHLKVDTGMARIGVSPDEKGLQTALAIAAFPELELEGIFTHFATMDCADESHALAQAIRFQGFLNRLEKKGLHFPVIHLSNSASLLRKKIFPAENAARIGIALYGIYPSVEVRYQAALKPALSLKSEITFLKMIPEDTPVGYGESFVSKKPMRIATVSAGYGDGIPRGLSNRGEVLIRGKRAGIVGRVCMDQFMVDVTDIPETVVHDEVVILGKQGDEEITIYELSDRSGRFPYEFLTCIPKRVPRVYTGWQTAKEK